MALAKLYETTVARLGSLPVVDGQIIFVRDSHSIYMDSHGLRVSYQDITIVATDAERLSASNVDHRFFFVEETHVLWFYNQLGWMQITPENLRPIFFGGLKDFPARGSNSTLYVDDDTIYKWDDGLGKYLPVANMTKWDELPE